jgi:hypothetical protein
MTNFKFTFGANHKAELEAYINDIITVTRAQVQACRDYVKSLTELDSDLEVDTTGWADEKFRDTLANRQLRIQIIENLTDCYFEATDASPDAKQLERLADAILYEELYSDDNYYVKHTEYPILNERKHESRTHKDVKPEGLETVDTGGKNQRKPTKRKRGKYENAFIDKHTRSKNRERRKKYHEFTKVQPVITRWITEDGELSDVKPEVAE